MNIILLSDGSGQRLWPLSNSIRSKQFVPLLKAPDGGQESMVQRVYRQIKTADPAANIVVATDAPDEDIVAAALAEPKIQKLADGMTLVKSVVVRGRLVSLIFKPKG